MTGTIRIFDIRSKSHPDYSSILYLLKEGKLEEYANKKEQIKKLWKEERYRICSCCGKKKLRVDFVGDSKYCNECKRKESIGKTKRKRENYKIWQKTQGVEQTCAKQIVYFMKKMGILYPKPCECCGCEKTQAHHDDYNFPWKVRWLCKKCHDEWHKNNEPRRVLCQQEEKQ